MKRFLIAVVVTAVSVISTNTVMAADGISINMGQPNFYGQLDPNGYPQPRVIYRQPRSIQRVPINQPPVYMRVPRSHAKNWRKYCHRYNACGERVLFVQDNWYKRDYAPRYQEQHQEQHGGNRVLQGSNDGYGRNH